MATRLQNLTVNRVALVEAGANFDKKTGDGAHIILFKAREAVAKKIIRRGAEWCVTSEDGSQTLGCHATRAGAARQLAAVEANKHAESIHTLCCKAEDMARTFDEIEANRAIAERIHSALATLQDSVWSILNDPEADPVAMIQETVAEFGAAILDEAPNLVTKAGRKISATRMKQLRSAIAALEAVVAEQEESTMAEKGKKQAALKREELIKALPEELQDASEKFLDDMEEARQLAEKALAKSESVLKEAQAKIEELEKVDAEEPKEEDILKGLPEVVRIRLEKAEAEAAESKRIAKEEREARQLQEFTKQAEVDIPNLPAETATKGRLLKLVNEKLEKEDADELLRLMKAGSEGIEQMLKISGSDAKPDGNSAFEKIEAAAAKIRETDQTLTKEQAFAKAIDENKELYGQYLNERRLSA